MVYQKPQSWYLVINSFNFSFRIGTSKRIEPKYDDFPGPGQYIDPKSDNQAQSVLPNIAPKWGWLY